MATQMKLFFGGHDLEDRINAWLKAQPAGFTLLQTTMTPFPVEPPGDGTTLAVSVWYRLVPTTSGKDADKPRKV